MDRVASVGVKARLAISSSRVASSARKSTLQLVDLCGHKAAAVAVIRLPANKAGISYCEEANLFHSAPVALLHYELVGRVLIQLWIHCLGINVPVMARRMCPLLAITDATLITLHDGSITFRFCA